MLARYDGCPIEQVLFTYKGMAIHWPLYWPVVGQVTDIACVAVSDVLDLLSSAFVFSCPCQAGGSYST